MECGNLVTVNDLWSPHTLYGMQEPCNCQLLLWSPLPYLEHVSYGSPTCTIRFFQDSFKRGPLLILTKILGVDVVYILV